MENVNIIDIFNAGSLVAFVILFALGKIRSTNVVDKEIDRIMQFGNDQMHALGKVILDGMEDSFEKAMYRALQKFHNGGDKKEKE